MRPAEPPWAAGATARTAAGKPPPAVGRRAPSGSPNTPTMLRREGARFVLG